MVALFFTQALLITNQRPDLHRKLGIAGGCLAAAMVVLGVAAAVHAIRSNHTPPGRLDPRSFLVLPFFGMSIFAILVGAGITFRRRPETHKRLMLLASIAMLDAAIARLPGVFALGPLASFGIQDMFAIAAIAYDFTTRRRIHPAYLWGGLFILLAQPLRIVVSTTPWWLAFGDWIKG